MVRENEFIPMGCPLCGSELYTVKSIKQYESGGFIQNVKCANQNCEHTIGLLEPNSIISKLSTIDIVLKRATEVLTKIEPQLGIIASKQETPAPDAVPVKAHQGIHPEMPKGTKYNTGNPQLDQVDDRTFSASGSKTEPNPPTPDEEDPLSSPPEADQSLE